jgi:hypothetical protein
LVFVSAFHVKRYNETMKTTLAQAKAFFDAGFLSTFLIVRHPDGWLIDLGRSGHLVDARLKTPRIFKTLDAVVSSLDQIGFQVDVLVPSVD